MRLINFKDNKWLSVIQNHFHTQPQLLSLDLVLEPPNEMIMGFRLKEVRIIDEDPFNHLLFVMGQMLKISLSSFRYFWE